MTKAPITSAIVSRKILFPTFFISESKNSFPIENAIAAKAISVINPSEFNPSLLTKSIKDGPNSKPATIYPETLGKPNFFAIRPPKSPTKMIILIFKNKSNNCHPFFYFVKLFNFL